jgi:hypothetical protein
MTDGAENVVILTPSPPPRKKLSSEATMKSRKMNTHYSLSKEEKEKKREDFRRKAVENEKQRRMERRRRQQEFLRAKSEEKENIELVTSHVVDMTLSTDQQTQHQPVVTTNHPPIPPPEGTAPTTDPSDNPLSPITVSAIPAAERALPKERESNLAPKWAITRSDEDMWDRALKKKGSMPPPSASRRKMKAQKLGDVRPHLYHFNAIQWVDGMRRSPH